MCEDCPRPRRQPRGRIRGVRVTNPDEVPDLPLDPPEEPDNPNAPYGVPNWIKRTLSQGRKMIHEQITIDETISFLNTLLAIDGDAVTRLIESRVTCNQDLVDHPTVQCGKDFVGMLGILNGLFGTYGPEDGDKELSGPITAVYEDKKIIQFMRTVPTEKKDA